MRRLLLLILLLLLSPLATQAQAQVSFTGSGSTFTVPNDPTVGTVPFSLARIDPTGARLAQTTDTTRELWVVTSGAGINPNVPAVLAQTGEVPCTMDATLSNTRGMKVVISPTTDGRCHPTATAPSTGYVVGIMKDNSTTVGQTAVMTANLISYTPGSGTGTGSVTSVGLAVPPGFTSTGGPINAAGTLTLGLTTETLHTAWMGPITGGAAAPTFRALDLTDLPPGLMTTCGGDLTGTPPNCAVAQASGAFALPGDVSQTLTGDVDDYAGCAGTTICRLTGTTADRLIRGIAGGVDGRVLDVCNVGTTNKLTLVDAASVSTSSATNRILIGTNVTLRPGACKALFYDSTTTRWRPWDLGQIDPLMVRTCQIGFGSTSSTAPKLPDDDDVVEACGNNTGLDWQITAVKVYANAGTPSFNPIVTGDVPTGTSILSNPCTATAGQWVACSVNGAPVVHSFSGAGFATCSTTPCTLAGNIATAGGVVTYGWIELIGSLK